MIKTYEKLIRIRAINKRSYIPGRSEGIDSLSEGRERVTWQVKVATLRWSPGRICGLLAGHKQSYSEARVRGNREETSPLLVFSHPLNFCKPERKRPQPVSLL